MHTSFQRDYSDSRKVASFVFDSHTSLPPWEAFNDFLRRGRSFYKLAHLHQSAYLRPGNARSTVLPNHPTPFSTEHSGPATFPLCSFTANKP